MDYRRFSTLTHSRTSLPSGRHVLNSLTSLGLTLATARLPGGSDAKKDMNNRNKNKNKKSTLCHNGIPIQAAKK